MSLWSRRTLLGSLVAGVGLVAGSGRSRAQAKVSKATAHYQDTPKDGMICADCRNFRPPNACQLVEGTISTDGWCSFYSEQT